MKTTLAVIASFTLLATGYLSLSLAILRPPRANYQQWSFMAALFLVQSALTLCALAGVLSGTWIRGLILIGSAAIVWVGASSIYSTLSGPHFQGYALVLGSVLVVQGLLTLVSFLRPRDRRVAA